MDPASLAAFLDCCSAVMLELGVEESGKLVELCAQVHPDSRKLADHCVQQLTGATECGPARAACLLMVSVLFHEIRAGTEQELLRSLSGTGHKDPASGLLHIVLDQMGKQATEQSTAAPGEDSVSLRQLLEPYLLILKLLLKIESTKDKFEAAQLEQLMSSFGSQMELLLAVFAQPMTRLMGKVGTPDDDKAISLTAGVLGVNVEEHKLAQLVELLLDGVGRSGVGLRTVEGLNDFCKLLLWLTRKNGDDPRTVEEPLQVLWNTALQSDSKIADQARFYLLHKVYHQAYSGGLRCSSTSSESALIAAIYQKLDSVSGNCKQQLEMLQILEEAVQLSGDDSMQHQYSGQGRPLTVQIYTEIFQVNEDQTNGQEKEREWLGLPMVQLTTHSSATFGQLVQRTLSELTVANRDQMRCQLSLDWGETFTSHQAGAVLEELGLSAMSLEHAVKIRVFPHSAFAAEPSMTPSFSGLMTDYYRILFDLVASGSPAMAEQASCDSKKVPCTSLKKCSIVARLSCFR
jgi:hypothetical protein